MGLGGCKRREGNLSIMASKTRCLTPLLRNPNHGSLNRSNLDGARVGEQC
jgi:hypothetical protein